jgi:hypothetical protein
MSMPRHMRSVVLLLGLAMAAPVSAQQPAKAPSAATQDFQAAKELERAVELLKMNEEDQDAARHPQPLP